MTLIFDQPEVLILSIDQSQSSYWRTVWTRPGDIPKKFSLSPEELDHVETCDSDEEQRRFLEQIVIDKDLPVAMRTIQVRTFENRKVFSCNISTELKESD